MTDTIAVPVELIENIKRFYPSASSAPGTILSELVSLLPKPVEVGDTLTADQIRALPKKSVIVDRDGDLWITGGNEFVSLVGINADGRIRNDGGGAGELVSYAPVLVHIGK